MRISNRRSATLIFWIPRTICILFACFISLFALDVFAEYYSFWETVLAFLMHMIPTAMVVLVLVVAWRWEWVGGVLFAALGFLYIFAAWGRFPLSVYFTIAGPQFLMSYLFFLNWRYKDEIRAWRRDAAV